MKGGIDRVDPSDDLKISKAESASVHVTVPVSGGSVWAIPSLCVGLSLIACCVLMSQVEANRKLVWERANLQADLDRTDRQVAVNSDFLERLNSDPSLAERLAQRQMKMVREGSSVLEIKGAAREDMSPFLLGTVPPSQSLPAYHPPGGRISTLFREPRSRLIILGSALFITAFVLITGGPAPRKP